MKVKNVNSVLLVALILASCAPAVPIVSPTETAVPMPVFSPVALTATIPPTSVPENSAPASEPTVYLSVDGPWLVYRHNALSMGYADVAGDPEEFVILNQDGVGRLSVT